MFNLKIWIFCLKIYIKKRCSGIISEILGISNYFHKENIVNGQISQYIVQRITQNNIIVGRVKSQSEEIYIYFKYILKHFLGILFNLSW